MELTSPNISKPKPKPVITTTTTTTTTTAPATTLKTTITTQPQSSTTAGDANACVLASTLSATFVILFFIICGVLYYLYWRKKNKSITTKSEDDFTLPIKTGPKNRTLNYHCNQEFQSDQGYSVPPKRQEPLPSKKGKKKEVLTVSPYHGSLGGQEEYSVPPSRSESFTEPPLPPNLAKTLKMRTEEESTRPGSSNSNDYYLVMESVRDEVYQNIDASQDDIYINN